MGAMSVAVMSSLIDTHDLGLLNNRASVIEVD